MSAIVVQIGRLAAAAAGVTACMWLAACATDIMLSDVQFVLRVVDDDTITRVFPGIEGMEVKYHRCRL